MRKVRITCDSTCDLTSEQKAEFGITTTALYVRLNNEEYRDGVNITAGDMFEKIKASGELPKTAAASIQDFIDLWKPMIDEGYDVVHLSISSEMSVCFQNARLAAQEFEGRVFVVDGKTLSTGNGLLAIEGSIMAESGMDAPSIAKALEEKREKLNVSFVLDTAEYLAKGGRCSAVAAFAAGLLKLRLCIEVQNGKMDLCKKYRGKMSNVLQEYVRDRLNSAKDVEAERIFITDSGVPDEIRELVKKTVLEQKPFARVLFSTAGCTVSSHCGPGTLGILFFNK